MAAEFLPVGAQPVALDEETVVWPGILATETPRADPAWSSPSPQPYRKDFLARARRVMEPIHAGWIPPSGYGWPLTKDASEHEKDLVFSLQCAESTLDYTRTEYIDTLEAFRWYAEEAALGGVIYMHRLQQVEELLSSYMTDRADRDRAYERLAAHRDVPVILGCFERMRQTTCAGGTHPVVLPTACAIEIMRFLYPSIVKH